MKKTFLLVPLAIILVMSLFLVSCEDEPEIKTYTVSFMDGETTAADPQTVEYGKTATAPTAPTKEGHTFTCWRKVGSSSPFDFAKEVITGDTVLEAVWDINTYTVTFKNYDDTEYATKDVFYNGKVDKPEGTPTRGEGYLFKYWTLDNEVEGQKKEYSFGTPVVGNLVLYPVFEKIKVTITFVGAEGVSAVPEQQEVEYGSTFVYPDNPTKDGYDFAGWKEKNKDVYIYSSTVIDRNMELEACWNKAGLLLIDENGNVNGNETYQTDREVEVIIIPEKINGVTPTKIANYTFKQWTYITKVVLPPTINSIGSFAFNRCSSLETVTIAEGCTSIGNEAFRWCENLTSIVVPSSVTSLGTWVFGQCTGLTSADIKANVSTIDINTFNGCDALQTISLSSSISSLEDNTFGNRISLQSISVPDENMSLKTVDGVLYDKNITKLICFPANKNVTTYTVPETVTEIGAYAFRNNKNLTSVIIPESVRSIGLQALYSCTKLSDVYINQAESELFKDSYISSKVTKHWNSTGPAQVN